jgi:hypothetical protein
MSLPGVTRGKSAWLFPLVVVGWLLADGSPGLAQDAPVASLAKMKDLNRQAIDDYAAEDYESAQLGLREAIALGQRAGLSREPFMARLFVNLGAIYVSGLKDAKRGARALQAALEIDPDIKPTDTLVTPELRELFARLQPEAARRGSANVASPPPPTPPQAAPAPAASPLAAAPSPAAPPASVAPPVPPVAPSASTGYPPPPDVAAKKPEGSAPAKVALTTVALPGGGGPEEPDLPARVPQPLYCPIPDEAPPDEKITLNCVLQPEVTASKVMLYYRPPGGTRFRSTSTVRSPKGWYQGVIPADVVQGRSLHFYLEARDDSNAVVGNAGKDDSPIVVLIREGATPVTSGWFAGGYRRRRGALAQDEDPLLDAALDRERERDSIGLRRRRDGAVYASVGVGWGYGYHGEQRLEFYRDATIQEGWIPSGRLHLTPELGYQFGPQFALSILARLQFISQAGSGDSQLGNPARSAIAVLARPQWLIGRRNAQLNLSGYLGGGDGFRLTVPPPQGTRFRRNDSVRGGPVVGGTGVGVLLHLNPHLALAADGRALVGFPDFALVLDLGATLQVGF